MGRPHWMPELVWIGVEPGKWPIEAWLSDHHARAWAAQDDRRRIFTVAVPEGTVAYAATVVPATTEMKQVHP